MTDQQPTTWKHVPDTPFEVSADGRVRNELQQLVIPVQSGSGVFVWHNGKKIKLNDYLPVAVDAVDLNDAPPPKKAKKK